MLPTCIDLALPLNFEESHPPPMGVGCSPHHVLNTCGKPWLQVVDYDEDAGDQNGKSSTLPYPFPYTQCIIITFIAFCQPFSMHRTYGNSLSN